MDQKLKNKLRKDFQRKLLKWEKKRKEAKYMIDFMKRNIKSLSKTEDENG